MSVRVTKSVLLDCTALFCTSCGVEWAGFLPIQNVVDDLPPCEACGGETAIKAPVEFRELDEKDPGDFPAWGIFHCFRKDENHPEDPFCLDAGEDGGWYLPLEMEDPPCPECERPMLLLQMLKIVKL